MYIMSMTICQPAMFVRELAPLSLKTPRGCCWATRVNPTIFSTTAWLCLAVCLHWARRGSIRYYYINVAQWLKQTYSDST